MMSYFRQKMPGEFEELQNMALMMKDPVTYEEVMSRSDAIHWKKACTEELEELVRQNLFGTVSRPVGHKVVGFSKQNLMRMGKSNTTSCPRILTDPWGRLR